MTLIQIIGVCVCAFSHKLARRHNPQKTLLLPADFWGKDMCPRRLRPRGWTGHSERASSLSCHLRPCAFHGPGHPELGVFRAGRSATTGRMAQAGKTPSAALCASQHPGTGAQAMVRGSLGAQRLERLLQCGRPGFDPWVGKIPWRRKRQPTPALLPGESHGQRSLVGCGPQGRKESDTTERLHSLTHSLTVR